MTEIKIMQIEQLLQVPGLRNSYDKIIIFVTLKPNYYDFGCTNFYLLNIADTDAPIITNTAIADIKSAIKIGKLVKTIYVCCDAGLSRSPAIAHIIAVQLGEYKQAHDIEEKYRFLNQALYNKLMEMM